MISRLRFDGANREEISTLENEHRVLHTHGNIVYQVINIRKIYLATNHKCSVKKWQL